MDDNDLENDPPRVVALEPPPRTPSTDEDDPSDFEIIQMERSKSMDITLKQPEGKFTHWTA